MPFRTNDKSDELVSSPLITIDPLEILEAPTGREMLATGKAQRNPWIRKQTKSKRVPKGRQKRELVWPDHTQRFIITSYLA